MKNTRRDFGLMASGIMLNGGIFIGGNANAKTVAMGDDDKKQKTIAEPAGVDYYSNPLINAEMIDKFHLEGSAKISFPNGRMRMENLLDPTIGQQSNFVLWCDKKLPRDIEISFDFYPIAEPGLCVAFFAADGKNGTDLFDKSLKKRNGVYDQYTNSDINALQISYFRRRWPEERAFHLCNLRRAPGFELLSQGADPIPDVEDAINPYKIKIRRKNQKVSFSINDLEVFTYNAPENNIHENKKLPDEGYFGFRQMAPLVAEYANFRVKKI